MKTIRFIICKIFSKETKGHQERPRRFPDILPKDILSTELYKRE